MLSARVGVILFPIIALAACANQPPEKRSATTGDHTLIAQMESALANRLFEDAYDERLARSPELQTILGIHDNDDRWDDYSDEFAAETQAIIERQWAEIQRSVDFDKLDAATKLSYRLFQYNVERMREGFKYRFHDYPITQMQGVHSAIPAFLINVHPSGSARDMENYIARLRGVAPVMEQVIEGLQTRADLGIVAPRFVFPHVIEAARNVITGAPFRRGDGESVLLADFREKTERLDLPDHRKQALLRDARAALLDSVGPAYESLIASLVEQQSIATSDDGAWKLPDGDAYYRAQLELMTTTDMTPEAIHQVGREEVWRIQGEMIEIMRRIGFEGTLQQFFQKMRTDEQFYLPNNEAGKQAYLDLAVDVIANMKTRLGELFLRQPRADLIVKAVEPFRENSAGKAFYQRPAPDGSRPGTFYVNLRDLSSMPTWELEALAYHEGIPGHHMQLSIAGELEGLPRFRKFGGYTAYSEGWGLYMERVPKEIGMYVDPYSDFGRLSTELWRAARLVVDTGIHAMHWTREEAIHYLKENTPNPELQCVQAIERYIVMPGQATAYKVGMLKLLELRERARERLGQQFDIREFHDLVLRSGPLPLSILEEEVDGWLAGSALSAKTVTDIKGRATETN